MKKVLIPLAVVLLSGAASAQGLPSGHFSGQTARGLPVDVSVGSGFVTNFVFNRIAMPVRVVRPEGAGAVTFTVGDGSMEFRVERVSGDALRWSASGGSFGDASATLSRVP
jgi:hypothetical protein